MLLIQGFVLISLSRTWVSCTISGLSYMDPINLKPKAPLAGEDPCNPLYWYPKSIPEYCNFKIPSKPVSKSNPVPLPIPVPLLPPQPFPIPMPIAPPSPIISMSPLYPIPPNLPMTVYPSPIPLPYGIPLVPTNPMLPVAGVPAFPYPMPLPHYRPQQQAGMIPGIPGLVSDDGGINILPFSDAYADLLEKHKQKLIRKKLQRVIEKYEDYPRRRRYGRQHRFS